MQLRQGGLASATCIALGLLLCYTIMQQWGRAPAPATTAAAATAAAASAAAPLAAPVAPDRFHQAPCPPPRPPGKERRNLVFAAVGDGWTADKWSFSEQAGWDLVAVYFGSRTDWDCPQCTMALRMPDSMKWQMLWALMTDRQGRWGGVWNTWRERYDYVMVADDDLVMDACTIDIFFESMRRHKVLAAQPSNCRGNDSDNPYWVHWQLPGMELHYVNVIEVTAPGLDIRFLENKVKPLLNHTFSGWGLPYCFSPAAGWPRFRFAVIDAACMVHPARAPTGEPMSVSKRIHEGMIKEGSIYSRFSQLTPFESPRKEQAVVWEECGMTPVKAQQHGHAYPPRPALHEVVLAEQPLHISLAAATAATAAAQPALRQPMGSAGLGRWQALQDFLLQAAQLSVAAVAGALAALHWSSRRAKCGHQLALRQVAVHCTPQKR